MWHWFRDYRRKKILRAPFPIEWERHIQNNIQYYQRLNNDEKKNLQNHGIQNHLHIMKNMKSQKLKIVSMKLQELMVV